MKKLILILTLAGLMFSCNDKPKTYCWNCKTRVVYRWCVPIHIMSNVGADTIAAEGRSIIITKKRIKKIKPVENYYLKSVK